MSSEDVLEPIGEPADWSLEHTAYDPGVARNHLPPTVSANPDQLRHWKSVCGVPPGRAHVQLSPVDLHGDDRRHRVPAAGSLGDDRMPVPPASLAGTPVHTVSVDARSRADVQTIVE